MNKTVIVVAVVLICSLITVASAVVVNQPPNPASSPTDYPAKTEAPQPSTPSTAPLPSTDAPAISTLQPSPTQTPAIPSPSPTSSLAVTPTPSASPETADAPNLFKAELEYAFVSGTNRTEQHHDHFGFGFNSTYTYYPVEMTLNLTYRGNPANEPYDAKIEGYLITFKADTGATANYLGYFGTNLNPTYEPASQNPTNLPFVISSLKISGFSLRLNLTANESFLGEHVFSSNEGNSGLGVWSNGTPTTVTVTLQRVGWIIFDEGSAWFEENPTKAAVLQQVELERDETGFLYRRTVG